jgi:hypothetical protein
MFVFGFILGAVAGMGAALGICLWDAQQES